MLYTTVMKSLRRAITSLLSGIRRRMPFIVLLLVFLGFLIWNGAWHIPSRLVMTGQTDGAVDAVVQWDSGNGFNDYESAGIVFSHHVSLGDKPAVVKIIRTGEKNPVSSGAEVWIKAIRRGEDDNYMPLERFAVPGTVELTGESLHIQKDRITVTVPNARDHTKFLFATNSVSGIVEIGVGEDRRRYDLYSPEDGERRIFRDSLPREGGAFTAAVDLPRYDIHRLKISATEPSQSFRLDAVSIKSARETVSIDLLGKGFTSTMLFSDVHRNTKQYLQPVQFIQQAGFASLFAYSICYLISFIRTKGGGAALFLQSKRPAFWLMLTGNLMVFSLWLLAYWPGHFTSDSVHIWWAARNPGYFIFQHPAMNVIFYRFLQQIWDHLAIVGIVQILMISILGSYIFYYLYKQGVSLWVILPFYFAFITSIPVGLYNITLWKDVPFAFLVLFWAFYFVKVMHEKRKGRRSSTRHEVVMLMLLLLAMGLFRYNGVVYLFLIPAGLMLFGIIPRRKFLIGMAVVLIVSSVFIGISIYRDNTGFIVRQTEIFTERMIGDHFYKTATRMVKQYPTVLDVNMYKKRHVWSDIWYRDKETTNWHYAFAKLKGYNEFLRYVPCEPKFGGLYAFIDRITRSSYEEPWVYMTWNPFYMLFLFLFCGLGNYFPRTAGFGYVVLSQVIVLLLVLGTINYNWRYYYFLLLSAYFLVPIMALDIKMRISSKS